MTRHDNARIVAIRTLDVRPQQIFAVLADPRGHVAIDGSGMLVVSDTATPLTALGQQFGMHMDRSSIGTFAELVEYDVRNTVTRFESPTVIEWSIAPMGLDPIGHVYGYELTELGGRTQVTHYCDWSGVSAQWRTRIAFPVVSAAALSQTLKNLEQVALSGAYPQLP